MRKQIVLPLIAGAALAILTLNSFSAEEVRYSEKEFFEIIQTDKIFTEEEAQLLIEQTDFETITSEMIRRCNGTSDDYCKGDIPDGYPRPKCCISVPPPQQ